MKNILTQFTVLLFFTEFQTRCICYFRLKPAAFIFIINPCAHCYGLFTCGSAVAGSFIRCGKGFGHEFTIRARNDFCFAHELHMLQRPGGNSFFIAENRCSSRHICHYCKWNSNPNEEWKTKKSKVFWNICFSTKEKLSPEIN